MSHSLTHSYAWLDDFDWSLRMSMSSDKISDLRKPILLLSFATRGPDGGQRTELVELTTEEGKFLLEKLKTVQKVSEGVRE
jgi:hypothetical protein